MSGLDWITGCGGSAAAAQLREEGDYHEAATMAILNGDARRLRTLLAEVRDAGGSVDALRTVRIELGWSLRTSEGLTLLQLAVREGQEECVQELLEAGARVDVCAQEDSLPPLHCAALFGHAGCLQLLLKAIPEEKREALVSECHYVRYRENYPLDPHGRSHNFITPLEVACFEGHIDCVRILLELGKAKTRERTAYKRVIDVVDAEGMRLLINHGEDPRAVRSSGDTTALHAACRRNNPHCVQLLLDARVDVEQEDYARRTALHLAAEASADLCVPLLLRHRALVTAQTPQDSSDPTASCSN